MAKAQKRSNRETRKPKSEKNKQAVSAKSSENAGVLPGLEHMKGKR